MPKKCYYRLDQEINNLTLIRTFKRDNIRAVGSSEKQGGDTLSSEKQGGRNLEIDLENRIFEGKIAKIH